MPSVDDREFLMTTLKGDLWAVDCCETLFTISQTLDDLIDGDKPVSSEQIISMMWNALVRLPTNEFYRKHQTSLTPLIQATLVDWIDGTAMEKEDLLGKQVAFVLRDSIGSLVIHVALLVGGYAWMREVSGSVRRYLYDESFDAYVAGLTA